MPKAMIVTDINNKFFTNNKITVGTSAPTSGTHVAGDMVISSSANANAFGWICTSSGTPGSWKTLSSGSDAMPNIDLSEYVQKSTTDNIIIHADKSAYSSAKYVKLKAGHNEVTVESSGGGNTVMQKRDGLRYNGYRVYHENFKPTARDIDALSISEGGSVAGYVGATMFKINQLVGGPNIGTNNYIAPGFAGPYTSFDYHSFIIRSYEGIGFRNRNDDCTVVIDTENGSLMAESALCAHNLLVQQRVQFGDMLMMEMHPKVVSFTDDSKKPDPMSFSSVLVSLQAKDISLGDEIGNTHKLSFGHGAPDNPNVGDIWISTWV